MNNSTFKKCLLLSLVMFVSTLSLTTALAQDQKIKTVSVEELEKIQETGSQNVILDVRTPPEIAEGYIEDSIFSDFLGDSFLDEIKKLDKSKTYFVVCKAGVRASKATLQMQDLGFPNVFVLEGGMDSWLKNGKPIVK